MRSLSRARTALSQLRVSELAAAPGRCPFCGPTLFVRLSSASGGLRCARCSAGSVQVSLGWALRETVGDLGGCDVCELSARGPLAAWLRRVARSAATSEYFADAAPGETRDGIRCEDVQRLTWADASFDLVTHTEVLEHVPDDLRALAELRRVLRPGGRMLFTVPLHGGERTVERARLREGVVEHLLEPVHHTDPLRQEGILAFRDYGRDIVDRLRDAGFDEARILPPSKRLGRAEARPVIAGRRPAR
jgi:SAM-dependent methyltransferase